MYVPHFVYPFIFWWTLRLLPPLGYCAAMIMDVYKYLFEIALSVLLGIDPEVELLDLKVILSVILWGIAIPYFKVVHHFAFLPASKLVFLVQTFLPFGDLFYLKSCLTWSPVKKRRILSPFFGRLVISGRPPPSVPWSLIWLLPLHFTWSPGECAGIQNIPQGLAASLIFQLQHRVTCVTLHSLLLRMIKYHC